MSRLDDQPRLPRLTLGLTSGLTLVEMLVVLAIISILASVALPYAEITVRRDKELTLKSELRRIRLAIDQFHNDWLNGYIANTSDAASDTGYPASLDILVAGVDTGDAAGTLKYYLRRIPTDPFSDQSELPEQHWQLRSYKDKPDSDQWGGEDVYDVRSKSEETAINGTQYKNW